MRRVLAAALCSIAMAMLAATASSAQSLAEAARRAKEQQKTSGGTLFKFDDRDVNGRLAAQEVLDYEIDPERWRKFLAATIWVNRTMEKDPALLGRLESLKTPTARSLERAFLREPAILKALASAGTDAHDFAFTQVALAVAMLLNQDENVVAAMGQLPAPTQANMALAKAHEKELKEMQAAVAALKAGMDKQ